jgi:hypothetical protein
MTNGDGADPGMSDIERMVQRLAREECPDGVCPIEPVLQSCVHDAVEHLFSASKITGYVPVLALKQVRDCIRAGTCEPRIVAT